MRISDWSSDVCSSDLGSTVSVQLAATDPDGPVDALRWTLVAAPAGATLSEPGLLTWFAADGNATADFRVRVADAEGAVAAGTFNVQVAHVAPALPVAGGPGAESGSRHPGLPAPSDPSTDAPFNARKPSVNAP